MSRSARSPSCGTTARPPAAAGSTPEFMPTASIRRGGASRVTSALRAAASRRSGPGRGPPTGGSSTTAPAPIREGRPWSERKRYVWWDEQEGRWAGYDVPDFPADKHPEYRPEPDARAMDAIGGADPFMMMADGRAWLYTPSGLLDGPLPTFYEPVESPVPNLLYPKRNANPAAIRWQRPENPYPRKRRPALSAGGDHVPADRASHGGRDEPHRPVAGGAAARDVRRDRSAARRRPWDRGRRLDDDLHRESGDRGAGQGHRPHPAPAG